MQMAGLESSSYGVADKVYGQGDRLGDPKHRKGLEARLRINPGDYTVRQELAYAKEAEARQAAVQARAAGMDALIEQNGSLKHMVEALHEQVKWLLEYVDNQDDYLKQIAAWIPTVEAALGKLGHPDYKDAGK
jgi:hypothetical protein